MHPDLMYNGWLMHSFALQAIEHSYLDPAATTPLTRTPELKTFQPAVCAQLLLLDMAVASSLPGTPTDGMQCIELHFPP